MDVLERESKYLLVDIEVLPEVFVRVVRAKQLLATGKAKNLSDAAAQMDISRSTLYKYKDCVFRYEEDMAQGIATLYAELEDRGGVLSSLLTELYSCGANILTINQNIPVDGVAPVSISMRTDGLVENFEALTQRLSGLAGIVTVRLLSK